jgi:prepilin-type N-terminal cleavage/methylation domain-containing protein
MKFAQKTIGFTLIELLVVITIIGILATGGVVTYTSQIQKARDTTRINDVKAIQSGLEQYYQDKTVYPDITVSSFSGITAYVPKMPKDPKSGEPCNKGTLASSGCDYAYDVADDSNGLILGEYKISTAFESK